LNKKTIELRELMAALVGDVSYQQKLIKAFRTRRLHPSTEIMIWHYAAGKPTEQIEVSATTTVNAQLAAEREILTRLDLRDLEQLASKSRAIIDEAVAMASRSDGKTASVVALPAAPNMVDVETPASPEPSEPLIEPAEKAPETLVEVTTPD